MTTSIPFGSPSFKLVARGFVELHRLIGTGEGDSPEAEAVRDAMELPSKVLNPTERERGRWLSEDLYSISDPPDLTTPKVWSPEAQQQLIEAVVARENRDWDRALLLLRQAQKSLAPEILSFLRGSIWQDAGHPHVAEAFFRHASACDPENATFHAINPHSSANSERQATPVSPTR